jgi:hypothetical protein
VRTIFAALLLSFAIRVPAIAADAPSAGGTVAPELWDRPRSAAAILDAPAVKSAVRAWLAHPDARIVIHHPAGQEAQLNAEELRSWLIALAVDGRHILLTPDRNRGEPLTIEAK